MANRRTAALAHCVAGGSGGAPHVQIPRDADRDSGIHARFNFGSN